MPVKEPSAPAPPLPSTAPAQERAPSPSNPLGDAPTIDPPAGKGTRKKKAPKRKPSKRAKATNPAPRKPQNRYEPYRKAEPTPEPEASRPADPVLLESLDNTAKAIFKADREALEYVESLRTRTAALLEYVNRTGDQLRSCKGTMERIQLFVSERSKMGDRRNHEHSLGSSNPREMRWDGRTAVLDFGEPDDEDNAPNPGLFPALTRDQNGPFPAIEGHFSKNIDHPRDYAQDFFGESVPQPPDYDGEEDGPSRPETPPARQPSLPPGHEDENFVEYFEDKKLEVHSDYPAPPDNAALGSDDSTFDCAGADLRIASDTGLFLPHSDAEIDRISKGLKREAIEFAAARAMLSLKDPLRPRQPLSELYIAPSPEPPADLEPRYLTIPQPIARTPSPPRTVLAGKRKRVSVPQEEEEPDDAGNIAGPSTAFVVPGVSAPRQVEARYDEGGSSPKRQKLLPRQRAWDFRSFWELDSVPNPLRANPPTRENSPPSAAPSRIQKEDSDLERSQVIEMLSHGIEQGESEDEEGSTENILGDPDKSRRSLPALTASNTRSHTQPEAETPAESQVPAEAPVSIPEDIFGPVILSVKADKISNVFEKDADRSGSGYGTSRVSSKSARFSFDGVVEKGKHKVFPKTPIRPRNSQWATQAESALAAEIEVESRDELKPLSLPKKKRAIGARARKLRNTPSVEAGPATVPDNGVPSISAGKPASRLRRGRSASVQPEGPALPKTPVRKSTRGRR